MINLYINKLFYKQHKYKPTTCNYFKSFCKWSEGRKWRATESSCWTTC